MMKSKKLILVAALTLGTGMLCAQITTFVDNFDNGDMTQGSGNADWSNNGVWEARWFESGTTVRSIYDLGTLPANWSWSSLANLNTFALPGAGETLSFELDISGITMLTTGANDDGRMYFRLVDASQTNRTLNFKDTNVPVDNIGIRAFFNDTATNAWTQGFHNNTNDGGAGVPLADYNAGLTWTINVTQDGYSLYAGATLLHEDTFANIGFSNPFATGMYPVISYGSMNSGVTYAEIDALTVVPEPATMGILAGFAGLAFVLIRRKRK